MVVGDGASGSVMGGSGGLPCAEGQPNGVGTGEGVESVREGRRLGCGGRSESSSWSTSCFRDAFGFGAVGPPMRGVRTSS